MCVEVVFGCDDVMLITFYTYLPMGTLSEELLWAVQEPDVSGDRHTYVDADRLMYGTTWPVWVQSHGHMTMRDVVGA